MKKLLFLSIMLLSVLTASAQFEQGKWYAGASLSGLNLKYSGSEELNMAFNAKGGYFVADDIMAVAEMGYNHNKNVSDYFTIGAQGRYYIEQNGLYLGAGLKFVRANSDYNDLMPGIEVGYSFFISKTVTIEPAIYYDQSFKNHSDYSSIGLKIGFGIYLDPRD